MRVRRIQSSAGQDLPPEQPSPELDEMYEEPDLRTSNSARNATMFAVLGSAGVLLWAAMRTNSDTQASVAQLQRERGWFAAGTITSEDLWRRKKFELKRFLETRGRKLLDATQNLPAIPRNALLEWYTHAANIYLNAPDSYKICCGIIALNISVFIAWKIPSLQPFMRNHFVDRPLAGRAHTLLTCMFSHQSFMHLFFNCYAFAGFGAAAGVYLQQQQHDGPSKLLQSTSGYHFLAFFVSAGLLSSLASNKLRLRTYDLIRTRLTGPTLRAAKSIVGGSLGASGAIYSCVVVSALAFPQAHVNIMFIPVDIPIRVAICGTVLLDVIGLLRGWRLFDHVAHLGGAMFGLVYYMYGPRIWDTYRSFSARWLSRKKKVAIES
ncbi:Rhomboid domain-containing protein [Mycena chlorophos]|uniref:Rhomboid domain-containing protein n=1 Tax=Mycena chlorophos TaxID=658473 RepID=A0A8H6WBD6_MYCCL|nr:Rhomboid domain-containing protein [Mycena chlorophos]